MTATCMCGRDERASDVMQTLRRLYAKLQLRINETKSAVARPWDRKFLGYSFWVAPGTRGPSDGWRPRPLRR